MTAQNLGVAASARQDTDFSEQQLANLERLRGTTMPDGSRYDGRYNLVFETMHLPLHNIDPTDPEGVARFYGVPLEAYLDGQKWADVNLATLRREAGLEPEEAAETGDVTQPEELSSSGEPLAPVVPKQTLLSFTVSRFIGLFWPFIL